MSGVYIKGRKPPNSCDDCWVSDCPNDEHIDGYRMMDRPTYCPLIPVSYHRRLIDADALASMYDPNTDFGRSVRDTIMDCPTIIPTDEEDVE